jgi:hypothetical protein
VIAWLPIAVVILTQITLRLISVACLIWQERAHAKSNCAQMETAAATAAMIYEGRQNGTILVIIPRSSPREEEASAADAIACGVLEMSA